MIDIVYIFEHSKHDDFELRYSLRSVEKNCPWVGKIWIYGDKPDFLTKDKSLIEHMQGVKGTFFQLIAGAAKIEGLSEEFYVFADDYLILKPFVPGTVYYLEDLELAYEHCLNHILKGLKIDPSPWKWEIRQTYNFLKSLGMETILNYETHVPSYLNKKWFKEFYNPQISSLTGFTCLLNMVKEKYSLPSMCIIGDRLDIIAGDKTPKHKTFMFYDDEALKADLKKFIKKIFPNPSKYEKE